MNFNSKGTEKVANKPSVAPITSEDFVGFNPILPDAIPVPLNSTTKMVFVLWQSPFEFYMQLKSMESKCDEMMRQIQQYYRKRAPIQQQKVPIGGLVLVRHRDDKVIKRARIIDYNEARDKYRVQFIDFGGKAICQLSDMFELEKSFTRLPALAICCTIEPSAILGKTSDAVHDKVSPFFDAAANVECKMILTESHQNTVEVHVNGANLRELLIRDNLLIHLPKGKQ